MAIAKDELGNDSALDYILKGGGKLFVANFGEEDFVYIGETNEIASNFEVTKNTLPDTESCPGGTLLEYVESTTLTLNFSSYSYTPENIARFFLGEVTDGQAPATDQAVVLADVKTGTYRDLGYINITSIEVKDETDTTTYVAGTDYVLDANGMLGIIIGGAIVDGDTLNVTLSADAGGDEVQYLHGEQKDVVLRFEGCASNGQPVTTTFYRATLSGTGDLPLKGTEPVNISFTAGCLPDPGKSATGSISQYATAKYHNAS